MTLMQIHTVLMALASIVAVGVFFAIQISPDLRSTHPMSPQRPLHGY